MSTQYTSSAIKQLLKKGNIRGFKLHKPASRNGHQVPVIPRPSPQKEWLELNLQYWCNERSLILESEYRFVADRKFRFDWAIPSLKLACEYEGIFSEKSRHTTRSGFTADTDKYNRATQEGWKVLRFTASNYKTLINSLNECAAQK